MASSAATSDFVITCADFASEPLGRIEEALAPIAERQREALERIASEAVPATITGEDVADLRWYFRTGGLSVFSESTFGTQLERAALFAHRGRPCTKCKGTGFVPQNPRKWRKTTEHERALQKFVGKQVRYLAAPFADRTCPRCQGSAWQVLARKQKKDAPNLTARPTAEIRSQPSYSAGDADMARLGRVTKTLDRMFGRDPVLVGVLNAYYGPEWEDQPGNKKRGPDPKGIGGLFALWPLTPAGKKVLRKNPQGLFALQLLKNEVDDQRERPNSTRKALHDTADKQATELINRARSLWNECR